MFKLERSSYDKKFDNMKKYIDADKLKAEIQKLRSESCISESDDYYEYAKSEIIDIIDSLQQDQSEVLSGEDVMTMCNQILIDWAKEGETQEEKEQREQAHMRFFELYDNYLMKEQPDVDLEKEIEEYMYLVQPWEVQKAPGTSLENCARHFWNKGYNARKKE